MESYVADVQQLSSEDFYTEPDHTDYFPCVTIDNVK